MRFCGGFKNRLSFLLLFLITPSLLLGWPPGYDPGPDPDPENEMARQLIDLNARIPHMPGISEWVMGEQKFRPAFGPVPWRMLQEPNSVKILFIGQDATHIAEAAGRPATAGFGGRAQDLARYFGVDEGAAFINNYAFTIRGQYGSYDSPYFWKEHGETKASFQFPKNSGKRITLVGNRLWLISQDPDSPITQWRNELIDWIFRNNKDSLQMVVTFGGAAGDAAAVFAESMGAKVGTRFSVQEMRKIQVPETKLEYAGGNNQFPSILARDGGDFYEDLVGRRLSYRETEDQITAQKALVEAMKEARGKSKAELRRFLERMVFSKAGPYKNGILHPAQVGGYDLRKMTIKGKPTLSLKGLKLSDGTRIQNDVLMVELPHPSALSRRSKEDASKAVSRALGGFNRYVRAGWEIPADPGETNRFAAGDPYVYARSDIGPEYYDFGTPATRMVPVSTASRMSKNPHVIVFGTRDRARFNMDRIEAMTTARPASRKSSWQMYTARPRTKRTRYLYDPGPGELYAEIMRGNLDLKAIFTTKDGKSSPRAIRKAFERDGIGVFNVKSHPDVEDFGHYRGTFKSPRVVILADPHGADDLITARALTGKRGQYLHGLMEDIGAGDQYLVIKTVPFGMSGATKTEWNRVLRQTRAYREALLGQIFEDGTPTLLLSDGPNAEKELDRILGENRRVVHLERSGDFSQDMILGGEAIARVSRAFREVEASGQIADIPRTHLSFYARVWEGTSGDRVLNANDKYRGLAFAVVAPSWATRQKVRLSTHEKNCADLLVEKLEQSGAPLPGERIPQFLERTGLQSLYWIPNKSSLLANLSAIKLYRAAG